MAMTTRAILETPRVRYPGLIGRISGGGGFVRTAVSGIVLLAVALTVTIAVRGRRVAEWAPIDVISSQDPLQELPVRLAGRNGVVPPARTHDAVLDMSRIRSLVIGVDLNRIPTGSGSQVVIRNQDGQERFRSAIPAHYFEDGRFMLRLFSGRFPAGVYWLEIEAATAGEDSRVVAASWFEVLR